MSFWIFVKVSSGICNMLLSYTGWVRFYIQCVSMPYACVSTSTYVQCMVCMQNCEWQTAFPQQIVNKNKNKYKVQKKKKSGICNKFKMNNIEMVILFTFLFFLLSF